MPDPKSETPKHVAIPIGVWMATLELLTSRLPMKEVEGLVSELRKGVQLDGLDERPDTEE